MSGERNGSLDSLDIDTGYASPDQAINTLNVQTNIASPTLEDEVEERFYREFMVSDDDLGEHDTTAGGNASIELLKDTSAQLDWTNEAEEDDQEVDADDEGAPREGSGSRTEPIPPLAAVVRSSAPVIRQRDSKETSSKAHDDSLIIDEKPTRRTPFRTTRSRESPSNASAGVPILRYFYNKLSKQAPPVNDTVNENQDGLMLDDVVYDDDMEVEDGLRGQGVVADDISSDGSSTESDQGEEEDYVDDDDEFFFWDDVDEDPPLWDPPVDWDGLFSNPLPTHFGRSMGYLRGSRHHRRLSSENLSMTDMSRNEADELVWEHRLFLQAVLQLLTERDFIGVEGSIDLSDNIWKKGPLKKWSLAVRKNSHKWKVKYCEVRRGNLCYYDDSGEQVSKTIHLRTSDTIVRAKPEHRDPFVLEIIQHGSPTRLWMAKSEEDLQAWIRTLQAAMIGGDQDLKESRPASSYTAYQHGMDTYLQLRGQLRQTDSQNNYRSTIRQASESPIQVPIRWIRDLPVALGGAEDKDDPELASPAKLERKRQKTTSHRTVQKTISQFWKDMRGTTFGVNGIVVPRDSPFAAERIVGALARCILEFDRAFAEESEVDMDPASLISELQSLSYTRDILLSVFRTKHEEDVIFAIQNLLENNKLIKIEPVETPEDAAAVHLEVTFAGDELPEDEFSSVRSEEISIWLRTRRKDSPTSFWKKRFAVLMSDGVVLNYFEAATPRPHGLRGQLALNGATVEIEESCREGQEEDKFVLCVNTADEQRWLSFESETAMMEWKIAIQRSIDSCAQNPPSLDVEVKQKKGAISKLTLPASKMIRGAKGGSIKVIRSAKDGGMKVFRSAVGILRQKQPGERTLPQLPRRPSMQMLMSSTNLSGKRDPTVQCIAQQTYRFVVSENTETPETLFFVQAMVFQAFLLSGGKGGRLSRGDALIEFQFDLGELLDEPIDF